MPRASARRRKCGWAITRTRFDFDKIDDRFAWELLFEQLPKEINMQMDVGNCLSGGGDPVVMLKEFPARTRTIHIKEYKDKTFDSDYYKEVLPSAWGESRRPMAVVPKWGTTRETVLTFRARLLEKLHRLGK